MSIQTSLPKKLTQLLIAATLGTSLIISTPLSASAASGGGITISLNGQTQTFAQPPLIIEDRVYLPARALLEAFGYQVEWNEEHRVVNAEKGKQALSFSLNRPQALYSDPLGTQSLPGVQIKVIDGRSMIPARTLSETLGMDIRWDAAKQTVYIDSSQLALFDAIMQDDVPTVRELLAGGTDPNSLHHSRSAMRYAVASRTPAIVKLLLEAGATTREADLRLAFTRGDAELVHFLLKNTHYDKPTVELATQLLSAILPNTEMILTLLELGADPNGANPEYEDAALVLMGDVGDSVSFEALLKAGADPNIKVTRHDNNQTYPILLQMVIGGNVEFAQLLLEFEADPNVQTQDGWTPLMIAADNGNDKLVQLLLAHGAKVNAKNPGGATALDIAKAHGNTATSQALIAAGAKASSDKLPEEALFREYPESTTSRYMTPLDAAVALGHTARVKQLLAAGSIQDETINRALEATVERGNIEILQALLEQSNSVPSLRLLSQALHVGDQEALRLISSHVPKDQMGKPDYRYIIPMSLGSFNLNSIYSFNLLLEAGFDPNAMLGDSTALMEAAASGFPGISQLLLEAGADGNLTNVDGETALDIAIRRGHLKTANTLLTASNLTPETAGNTLFNAVKRDSMEMVEALLKTGADPHFKTQTGRTPLQLAEEIGNPDMLALLKSAPVKN